MKRTVWWLVVSLFLSARPGGGEVVDRIVAIVNDEVITLSELNSAFEPYRKKIEKSYGGPDKEKIMEESRRAYLNRLIDVSLIAQEAEKKKVSVKDEEVTAALQEMLKKRRITIEDLTKELARGGMTVADYKRDLKEQMVRMNLVGREIKSRLLVTDEEIGKYYREHRSDYEGKAAVRIKQIFLPFSKDADEREREALKSLAEEISGRLKGGESFDRLAAAHSQGPASGDLGFIEQGMLLPEVDEAAFQLKKGEVSGVIRSRSGFHIILVIDKRGAGLKPFADVREEIQVHIEEEKMEKKFAEWLAALREKSHIEIKL